MIVEAVRLLITLLFTALGFQVGRLWPDWFSGNAVDPDVSIVVGAVVGAGVGYVVGGGVGRQIRKGLDVAPQIIDRATGPELFAGAFGVVVGVMVGTVIAVPFVVLTPHSVGWFIGAIVVVVLAAFGARIFSARAHDLLAAAGLRARDPVRRRTLEEPVMGFLIDSSAAIDGRILELARSGLIRGQIWVPEFVLGELQGIADSGDRSRRRRGRRGLDVLDALRDAPGIDFAVLEESVPEVIEIDAKLATLAERSRSTLVTTDHNLARVGELRGIAVLNPHALGESMRPLIGTGDQLEVTIEKAGSEPGQGVGYLDDGTMVVVSDAAELVGDTVLVEVSNALRTSVGRMIFARVPQ
jgi:uncharacterized protein YacL